MDKILVSKENVENKKLSTEMIDSFKTIVHDIIEKAELSFSSIDENLSFCLKFSEGEEAHFIGGINAEKTHYLLDVIFMYERWCKIWEDNSDFSYNVPDLCYFCEQLYVSSYFQYIDKNKYILYSVIDPISDNEHLCFFLPIAHVDIEFEQKVQALYDDVNQIIAKLFKKQN